MKLELILNPILKSKWRKVYLIFLLLFTSYILFLLRKEFTFYTLGNLILYILFYTLFIFPIIFFFFTLNWCWKRYGFLSWEEVVKIILYSLIIFITILDIYEIVNIQTKNRLNQKYQTEIPPLNW
jgi:hypothetical protein